MIFVTQKDVGKMVLNELRDAAEVRIAVAYFNPDEQTLAALRNVPQLTLIVSEEFTINNPYKLEELVRTAKVRSVPPYSETGKLHAKVLIVTRTDGSLWTLVGSANLTWQGLFSNQEACIALESQNEADRPSLRSITNWFDSLLTNLKEPDFVEAKQIFDTRSQYRLERRPESSPAHEAPPRYWALKSTSGPTGEPHWASFVAESVIAIGWEKINVDPCNVSEAQLSKAIAAAYPKKDDPKHAASTIKKFVDLNIDDIVLICRGYKHDQKKPVHIHGVARVTGKFRNDRSSNWRWRFKHDAVIQVIDMFLPKDVVANALEKGTLMQTIHQLDRSKFERLTEQFGVHLEV